MFDFIGFLKDVDFKETDNIIGNVLKKGVKQLDRPLGAIEGGLANFPDVRNIWNDPGSFDDEFIDYYKGINRGFNEPEAYSPKDIGILGDAIDLLPERFQRPAEIASEVALDPLTYLGVGLVGKAKHLGPIGNMLLNPVAGRNASLGRRVTGELATNLGARAGSEGAANLAEGTPLEGIAPILGGVLGGVSSGTISARALRQPGTKPVYSSMTEEQLEEGHIFDYLDSLDKNPVEEWAVEPYTGPDSGTVKIFNSKEEALAYKQQFDREGGLSDAFGPWKISDKPSQYEQAIQELYRPDPLKEVEIQDIDNAKFIERNINIIPQEHALRDDILNDSHDTFTTRFFDFSQRDPEVHSMLENWINEIGGKPASVMRRNFSEGSEAAKTLYNEGEAWRNWAQSVPESELIRDFNGQRYAFLYRGEQNDIWQMSDGRSYNTAEDSFTDINVYDPKTGETNRYSKGPEGYLNSTGPSDFIPFDLTRTAKLTNLPLFDKGANVQSYTSDPNIYASGSLFTSGKKVIDPVTGAEVNKKFILGRWIPIDDIIGPVGKNSQEKEFLVLDRNLVDDGAYQRITGVGKNDTPTTRFKVDYVDKTNEPTQLRQGSEGAAYYYQEGDYFVLETNSVDFGQNKHYLPKQEWELSKESDLEEAQGYSVYEGKPQEKVETKTEYFADEEAALKFVKENNINVEDFRQVRKGGYGTGVINESFPRNAPKITTGSGDIVDYTPKIDYDKWADSTLVNKEGFETTVKAAPNDYWEAVYSKDGSSVISKDVTQVIDALKSNGFIIKPSKGEKLLDSMLNWGDPGPQMNIAGISNPFKKSNLKLKPISQPSNVLAANTVLPNQVTPTPANATGLSALNTKSVVDSFLTTHGIDSKIATQLSSMSKADRVQLADDVVNNLSLHGSPSEDIVRTVINGFQKAGKGDSGKLAMANNAMRGLWASGDGSWIGIQGLLSIPHMLVTGRVGDATDVMVTSMRILGGNKEVFRKYVQRTLENMPAGAPSLNQAVEAGLHLAFLKGNQDINFQVVERLSRNRLQPDNAFAAAGDVARISEFYNTWRRYKNSSNLDLNKIAQAVNRGTGIAERPFGGYIGSFALFAPRFFQSQLEVISKSFTDGGIEGNLARRQLFSLLGTGVALTVAANELRGHQTEFDPTNSNFLRIRDVGGQDVSVFGPWDSLAKLVVNLGQGDFEYARSKFSPLMTVATNLMMGENFRGEPFPPTGNPLQASAQLAKSMLLPFAWQDIGEGGAVGMGLNFFGVKNSPLSAGEKFDANMQNLGLDPNDPLARRQFLADHPEQRILVSEQAIEANEIRTDINGRAKQNEQLVASDQITLTDFRENRKILSREMRNKLDIITQGQDFKADTMQKRWVESYYSLFDNAQDPVTHDIVGSKFDPLEAEWIETNGQGAYEYVLEYLGIGKNPIEAQYLADMRELDKLGYFDMKKYDESIYASGLDDDQIEDYRTRVSNARNVNPELADMSYEDAIFEVLGNELEVDQMYAISDAGSQDFANVEAEDLKNLRPELFAWFNPKATWSMYNGIKNQTPAQRELAAFIN